MTEREELLKRLERVKALAERGVGGEKENAEALLKRLMEKYEISDEDIVRTAKCHMGNRLVAEKGGTILVISLRD